MIPKKAQIQVLIYQAMDDIKDMVSEDDHQLLSKEPETVLYGTDAVLDSMAIVALVIAVEEKIYQNFGKTLVLANEKAVSLKHSPFKTVSSLSDYILQLMDE
ncbi:MAG: hypothetical protein AAF403_08750 [Pseudomonadota bacterium]